MGTVHSFKSRSPKEISALFDFIMTRPDLAVDAPQGLAKLRRPHQDVRLRLEDEPCDALLLHGGKCAGHTNRLRHHIHMHPVGALPYLHCGGEKGKPCTYFDTLCLCHMSSARSTRRQRPRNSQKSSGQGRAGET